MASAASEEEEEGEAEEEKEEEEEEEEEVASAKEVRGMVVEGVVVKPNNCMLAVFLR